MTDCDWAALRPETAVLMLAASAEPDEDDVLTVRVRHEPGYVLVTVAGEVDFASAPGLRERLVTLAAEAASGQRRRASGNTNHSPANMHVTNAVISPAVRPLET